MQRTFQIPRRGWPARLEAIGFHFHSLDEHDVPQHVDDNTFVYWREDVAYRFTSEEIERIYAAALELNQRCLDAVEYVIARRDFARLGISPQMGEWIARSWERDDPTLYGRFDFTLDPQGVPKLYEYNADTPTSIIEASLAQWFWKEDVRPEADQFNSLHEALIARWRLLRAHYTDVGLLHFACQFESQEDVCNVEYLMDTAVQAGWSVKLIDMKDIGSDGRGQFIDLEGRTIELMFKLYPWEWMADSAYASDLLLDRCRWVEPPWKMVLSNKGILPILWECFPDHPNLLEASFDANRFAGRPHARKPLFSREGANVTLTTPNGVVSRGGEYGREGYVYQAYMPCPRFATPDGERFVTLGAWIVDDAPAGLCMREQSALIATNTSWCVPHFFTVD
ncbi:glutathionylspermidine synthase family protein [Paraburkholderia sp. Tr-20389]|uniref:glutathionylspermidine synthase family protein n=1 Tax=Paraburkholderia sp. Tr-20389 TaxID=2703903 RepID=UPI0019809220|nr:glutathionylspermidine synthase family protein [Paraburkholderia sp. Tr-20389]MBN3751657.1 glutathionylspermidine synthase family protein [Paraburkholderia sp. Tr-20389]